MENKNKLNICRLLCAILCVLLLCGTILSCAPREKTLMSLGKQSVSVNMYELLLSRMKGVLAYNEYPVDSDAFWDEIISAQGTTYDDFFCGQIREEAKKMLAKLYIFEEIYQLTLPQSYYDEVDADIADLLELGFDGSKADLNRELSQYGVNMEILRENYVMEKKISYLLSHISSITSDAAREEHYQQNYVCFRQILFPLYEYVYETDVNGDVIYYHEGTTKIYYDVNGVAKRDENGALIVDENGDIVYFREDGRIAYHTAKGVKYGVDEDKDGYIDYNRLDDESVQVITDRVNQLNALIENGDFSLFEQYGAQWSQDDVWSSYPNGIYLNLDKEYSIDYLKDIQDALSEMETGELALIASDHAYHLVMKYELTPNAYKNPDNQDWFETFDSEVSGHILDSMIEKYIPDILVDEDVLSSAKSMKTVGINVEY